MVLLEFSVFPLGQGESVSRFVAGSLDIVDRSGLPYQCHAMGTIVEGQWDEVFELVNCCCQAMAAQCDRVECTIKIDYRKGAEGRLRSKVSSIEQHLGREVEK
ncbi:MAG: MTH1187 family thiamine-binding protein [Pirellulales bacterium]|nr:MTH1187 family thiamine-binding protein [Pirellulales bacterium]